MTLRKLSFILFILPFIVGVIYFSKAIIAPFVVAFFLAYALNPVVRALQKKGARRDLAILSVYLVIFLLGAMLIEIVLPQFIHDLTRMVQKMPTIFNDFQSIEKQMIKKLNSLHIPINFNLLIPEFINRGETIIRNSLDLLGRGLVNFISKSLLYALVPLLAYYISRDYPRLKLHAFQWVLKNFGRHWTQTFLKIDAVFKYYIRGQLLDTLIVGSLFSIGLTFLGFEASILLGFTAGIFNLIPYFGPVLGAIPLIFFALFKSPWMVLYVIILFLVVNQIEIMFLAPRIISSNLHLNPVFVIFLILMGGEIFGLVGMIMAVPLGAILLIILKSWYEISFGEANNEPILEELDFNLQELD